MAADITSTVRECTQCGNNLTRLMKKAHPLTLFLPEHRLESVPIDILGPLPKRKRGFVFILVIGDRFTKVPQIVPLRPITTYDVAINFTEHWVFKYGHPPHTPLRERTAVRGALIPDVLSDPRG